jgi:predicted RecB family nuclease
MTYYPPRVSKSDFLKYQCCPSYLWLWKHNKDVVPVDEEETIRQRLEQGNEVELVARQLFPQGVLIESINEAARDETKKIIDNGSTTIFQATAISDEGLFAMADVIQYDKATSTWTLFEVKSTNSVKKEHIYDVAFQKVTFEEAGYKIGKVGVIYLNKEYKRKTEIKPKELLLETDISYQVQEIEETIKQQAHDALEMVKRNEEPKGCSCRLKTRSNHCPTFHYLNPDIPEYSVFNISRIGNKTLGVLVDGEIYNVEDVPEDVKLSVIQQNQVSVAKNKEPIIDRAAIAEFLSEAEYPLYFLDYETVSTAIPLFIGCTPYQQIPFQYSLHVLKSPDAELEHFEFLARDSKETPSKELIKSLTPNISEKGSVVVWYKSFETRRNTEMGNLYPECKDLMESINSRVIDLMDVFSKQYYVHHEFNGSSSIKKVLPVLVPEFSYKDLDIQNGLSAAIRWHEAVSGTVEPEKVYDSLLKYCCLDTLAMVKIYEFLRKV